MANEIQIRPRGVVGAPRKYINIFSKKIHHLLLFLWRQLNSDLKELLLIIANNKFFQLLAFSPFYTTPVDNTSTFDCYKSHPAEAEDSPPV